MTKATTNTLLRTPETWARYQHAEKEEGCFICNRLKTAPIREFEYFAIIENKFPYDAVAEVHHMLVPKRHGATRDRCTGDEAQEMWAIGRELDEEGFYDSKVENFAVAQSQPSHYHLHLVRWKRV
jgi:diadenosine tetraphosphate (Ap4A) HIT family hydrolase